MVNLIIAEGVLIFLLVVLAGIACWRSRNLDSSLLRGLALPTGTVRSILALLVVGSYVIFIFFGAPAIHEVMKGSTKDIYQQGISAFTGIAGTVLGFYFGSRGATPTPPGQ